MNTQLDEVMKSLVAEFAPQLKKAMEDLKDEEKEEKKEEEAKAMHGKAEDKKDEEKEDEKKEEGKAMRGKGDSTGENPEAGEDKAAEEVKEPRDEESFKEYYSEKSMTLTKRGAELLNKAIAAEEASKKEKETAFQKSVVTVLNGLTEQIKQLQKAPTRMRKSLTTDYDVIEKGRGEKREDKFTVAEACETMNEMVKKGDLESIYVCEMNGTGTIADPLVKSRVLSALKEKRRGMQG